MYSVVVIDNNNCKGSDSVKITTILSSPANFLPADTSVCSYGSLQLSSNISFINYLWNTNAITKAITVTNAGVYWLQVKDKNNCSGRDSIVVSQKQCLQGFFIPNSFTPNNDGRNDVFKPLVFGRVQIYEFTVYNKWGETIFKSNDINKGWDGTYKGLSQQSNVFVWTCKYQFENEPIKIEKGKVLLLK
jgi:gliding motility-associated-like protein